MSMYSFATIHLIRRCGTAAKPGRLETSGGGAEGAVSVVATAGDRSAVGARPCTKAAAVAVPGSPGVPV